MVVCLERGADLHMAQLMPLPLRQSTEGNIISDNLTILQVSCTQEKAVMTSYNKSYDKS